MERILGIFEGKQPGPLLVFIGGIHGNEKAGVQAIQEVFRQLESHNYDISGTIIGLAGNLQALERGRRYIDKDMNRAWQERDIERLLSSPIASLKAAEDLESLELIAALEHVKNHDYSSKIMVDLHTTSAEKGNFIVIPEDESEHPVVKALHLPVVIDLEKYLEGTLLHYMHQRGFMAFAFEGGLIGSREALELHISGIWELIFATGCVDRSEPGESVAHQEVLKKYAVNLPSKVKVLHRHWVEPYHGFTMLPGFHNFDRVVKGQTVAQDRNGEIKAPQDGMIFMPLYQPEGNDGFFIVEEVASTIDV